MNQFKLIAFGLASVLFLNGCAIIGYSSTPVDGRSAPQTNSPKKLSYSIADFGGLTFGGYDELTTIMRQNRMFKDIERVKADPKKGLYLEITTKVREPSVGAFVWGYIALLFLFMLPAYAGSSGFYVQYQLYKDGEKAKYYEYEIRRKAFAWLPVIPFVWVNLLTDSEEDAFREVTNQFFKDATNDKAF